MCRAYAHSLMPPPPAGPPQGQPAPVLAMLGLGGPGRRGHKASTRAYCFTPTTCRARHTPASTSFLTQKIVYISLHFQGYHGKEKCQEVPFFEMKAYFTCLAPPNKCSLHHVLRGPKSSSVQVREKLRA